VIVVLEDLHWADAATLDLIKEAGRLAVQHGLAPEDARQDREVPEPR
jgi:hypothetical protein